MRKREYIVEIKKGDKWIFRSGHNNEVSALSNYEAICKLKKVRVKRNGIVILDG